MTSILLTIGRLTGAAGVLLTLFAGGWRFMGHFWLGSLSTGTVLLGGMGGTLIGSFLVLTALSFARNA